MSIDIVIKVTLCASGPDIDRDILVANIEYAIGRQKAMTGLSAAGDEDYIETFKVEVM